MEKEIRTVEYLVCKSFYEESGNQKAQLWLENQIKSEDPVRRKFTAYHLEPLKGWTYSLTRELSYLSSN